ncbi:transposable element Tcb2 transposase [Trichonephila clavipes]|nr:transposable element Tcb2 transposase [Trichonephila clavipes]
MDWPAYSPDLNPIEHVWDALGRRIAARLDHPENTQQLKQMLIDEWALLPQEMLHQLVLTTSDYGPRNSSRLRARFLRLTLALAYEHHAGDSTILLSSTRISRKNTLEWSGDSHLSSPSTNLTRGLAARRLFRVPPYRKGTIHLQTSMFPSAFEPRPNGTSQSARAIDQQLCTATGRQVSRFTVARRLHKGGLFARRPERYLPLKIGHRRHRLQWCREHKNWTTDQWSRVLFTDESRFSTRSDSQRFLIWRDWDPVLYQ